MKRGPSSPLRTITVCNIGGETLDLDGYSLETSRSRFRFPPFTLRAGHVALVVRGYPPDPPRRGSPIRFQWHQPAAREATLTVLTLRSPAGKIIDRVDLTGGRAAMNRGGVAAHPAVQDP